MTAIRLIEPDDAGAITELLVSNRAFLAHREPARQESYFAISAERERIAEALDGWRGGRNVPLVVLDDAGGICGQINCNGLTRGAFSSVSLGYWVSEDRNGLGIASRCVGLAVDLLFGEYGLHRVQAEIMPKNVPSQRVAEKNGFRPYGVAERYLRINGVWETHILYQSLNDNWRSDDGSRA
jgi:ribosomal-protein-alanine N-acetyltransferase